jgi:D-alanyl-D-alanine carboxypeptidase (penicillin-binding protein 5/6)
MRRLSLLVVTGCLLVLGLPLALVLLGGGASPTLGRAAGVYTPTPTPKACSRDCPPTSTPSPSYTPAPRPPTQTPTPCPACGQDENTWQRLTSGPAPPVLLGHSAALFEASCGAQIFGLNSHERLPPASLTKIATALAVVQHGNPSDIIDITINGWDLAAENGSSIMGLEAGMRLSVEELLYGLLLPSGNDAAIALGDYLGGEQKLVGYMNAEVRALGLADTHFVNPHGLDAPDHYSTTFDMALLGRALLANDYLANIVHTTFHQTDWSPKGLWNGNWLLYIYPEAVGVKTGYTEEAGGTIVSAATHEGRTLIASVFNSDDVYLDSLRLFRWAFASVGPAC